MRRVAEEGETTIPGVWLGGRPEERVEVGELSAGEPSVVLVRAKFGRVEWMRRKGGARVGTQERKGSAT